MTAVDFYIHPRFLQVRAVTGQRLYTVDNLKLVKLLI